jgi:5-(carboxyamino)imidazole ribonucleotide synthase
MTRLPPGALPPGAVIGILGGGQLGRMTALAAARLGYRTHIFCPDEDPPAAQVTPLFTRAEYGDRNALTRFARAIDVATFEFENIPVIGPTTLAALVPVLPGPDVLATCQDRVREKSFLNGVGVATAAWRAVEAEAGLAEALEKIGVPAVLKTTRLGYDGKGQARLHGSGDAASAWRAIGGGPAILEALVDFACEISVVIARAADGRTASYVPVENRHKHGILDETVAPARVAPAIAAEAERIAGLVASRLGLVGVLAIEMFVTRAGAVLVNELAPRPHNSGHWTIDACAVSQFEQLVRAVCGLPLGDPARFSDAIMKNLIGDEIDAWPALLAEPGARLHLYGKAHARPGRKMGHVTRLKPRG